MVTTSLRRDCGDVEATGMTAGRLFRTANRERGIEADAPSRGRCSGSLWRPQRRQVREGVTGCTSVLVAPDHFAARG